MSDDGLKIQDPATLTTSEPLPAQADRAESEDIERQKALDEFKVKMMEMAGVTQEEVNTWKETYGDVILIVIAGKPYIHRVITHEEYKEMNKLNADETDLQVWVVHKCVLAPKDFASKDPNKMPGGVIASLERSIEANSGFQPDTQPIML